MTEPEAAGWEDYPKEGDAVLIAGIRLHVEIIQEGGNQKLHFTYLPTVRDRALPESMTEFNSLLEELCSRTVAAFPANGYAHFHTAIRNRGGVDRCWYWLKITLRNDEHGRGQETITTGSISICFMRILMWLSGRGKHGRLSRGRLGSI